MPTITMDIVHKPRPGRMVFRNHHRPERPIMRRDGEYTFVCGRCGAVLLKDMPRDEWRDDTFQCGTCFTYNVVPDRKDMETKRAPSCS